MATNTGVTIASIYGGKLTGYGKAIVWCGFCGCNGTTIDLVFDLGDVSAGRYSVIPISVPGCNVTAGGQFGTFASFNGSRKTNQADGGEWIYQQGSMYMSLIEKEIAHDCINGNCLPKTTYNTPGAFDSLEACLSGCAKNSNCTGECVSTAEIAALKQSANNLQSRICK